MQDLKSPISKVASVLKVRSEGMGLRATARVFGMDKKTISVWEQQFGALKETLMLYSLCQQFVSVVFEGDELYTAVGKRSDADRSKGCTAVIMDSSSRFIVDQQCGPKMLLCSNLSWILSVNTYHRHKTYPFFRPQTLRIGSLVHRAPNWRNPNDCVRWTVGTAGQGGRHHRAGRSGIRRQQLAGLPRVASALLRLRRIAMPTTISWKALVSKSFLLSFTRP